MNSDSILHDCSAHSILCFKLPCSAARCVPMFCEWRLLNLGQDRIALYRRKHQLLLMPEQTAICT